MRFSWSSIRRILASNRRARRTSASRVASNSWANRAALSSCYTYAQVTVGNVDRASAQCAVPPVGVWHTAGQALLLELVSIELTCVPLSPYALAARDVEHPAQSRCELRGVEMAETS